MIQVQARIHAADEDGKLALRIERETLRRKDSNGVEEMLAASVKLLMKTIAETARLLPGVEGTVTEIDGPSEEVQP